MMLAELPEAQATGRAAEIYDAIRVSQGVGMVSMVYRLTAVDPMVRDWSWRIMGPEFVSGRMAALAAGLTQQSVAAFLATRLGDIPPPPPLPQAATAQAIAVAQAFNRANPMNYLYGSVLVRALDRDAAYGDGHGVPDDETAAPVGQPPATDLPPILTLDEMAPRVREIVLELSNMGVGKEDRIIPSYFRHLAHLPDYIDYIRAALTAPGAWDLIEAASQRFRNGAQAAVDELWQRCAPRDHRDGKPQGTAREELRAVLATFQPRNGIMIAIGNLLYLKHQGS